MKGMLEGDARERPSPRARCQQCGARPRAKEENGVSGLGQVWSQTGMPLFSPQCTREGLLAIHLPRQPDGQETGAREGGKTREMTG